MIETQISKVLEFLDNAYYDASFWSLEGAQ
jgi:hypothetical protein